MRAIMVHVLSVIGLWSCQKAIDLADHGHLDFEVDVLPKQPTLYYYNKPKRKSKMGLMLIAFVVFGLVVWSVLTLACSINNAGQKVTDELKREHREEIKIKEGSRNIFRKFVSFH